MMTVQHTEQTVRARSAVRRRWRIKGGRTGSALLITLLLLAPFLWMVVMAFRPSAEVFDLTLWFTPTLDAFRALIAGNFLDSFSNSLWASLLATFFSLLL